MYQVLPFFFLHKRGSIGAPEAEFEYGSPCVPDGWSGLQSP